MLYQGVLQKLMGITNMWPSSICSGLADSSSTSQLGEVHNLLIEVGNSGSYKPLSGENKKKENSAGLGLLMIYAGFRRVVA